MRCFTDPIANLILGVSLSRDKVRRRKLRRLESYSHTSYRRLVSRLKGDSLKDYAAAVRPMIISAGAGRGLELIGPAPDVAETGRDLDIPALEKAIGAEIQLLDDRIGFLPAASRWTPRLALWLACDLADRGLGTSLRLALPQAEKEEALRLLHREVRMDADGMAWLQAMAPDWTVRAGLAGFHIVGTSAAVAPYRAEVELASEILGDVCDVFVAQGDRKGYVQEWRPDSRHHLGRMKELLLRLGFSECEAVMPHLPNHDTVSRISALEKECKGKPYPHQFFAEAAPDQTLSVLAVWHVSAGNDPNMMAGAISSLLKALRIDCIIRSDETGAKLLYSAPDGQILARLVVAPEEALKAAAPQYRKLVIAEVFPESTHDQESKSCPSACCR